VTTPAAATTSVLEVHELVGRVPLWIGAVTSTEAWLSHDTARSPITSAGYRRRTERPDRRPPQARMADRAVPGHRRGRDPDRRNGGGDLYYTDGELTIGVLASRKSEQTPDRLATGRGPDQAATMVGDPPLVATLRAISSLGTSIP